MNKKKKIRTSFTCPVDILPTDTIQIGHGGGGKLTHELIANIFAPGFANTRADTKNDQAIVPFGNSKLAFTTDSYVVNPLFFPGGNIGDLAVNGTVNDLAMGGARPFYISAAFILEEGFSMLRLRDIVASMRVACTASGVALVTGDTKVVNKGKGDGVFIATAGVGMVDKKIRCGVQHIRVGDKIIISGPVGNHGITILSQREGLELDSTITSDTAPLTALALPLAQKFGAHCMRDLTRGGLMTALVEIAEDANIGIEIREEAVPVDGAVEAACEIFGLDPFAVANEGKMIAFVPPAYAKAALAALRKHPLGKKAAIIGEVTHAHKKTAIAHNALGGSRILDMPSGEQLPRIC
ncbi:MAG: hydrogenase expression/formation protein HypE [Patescibacteria group bacterium]|mgnify:FL=1